MRQNFNYHTHTSRCGHAVGTDEEYVQAAIKAGYRILGFSDHGPKRHYSNPRSHMEWSQIDEYIASIRQLQEKYCDQIRLLVGFETEFYPELLDEKIELRQRSDYLLLGQHASTPDSTNSNFHTNTEEEILIYGQQVCQGLESGLYTYLCHPDLIMYHQESFTDACAEAADMIGRKAAETGIPLEVNVHRIAKGKADYAQGKRYPYPNLDFWKILARYPVRCIFGVDAHNPEQLLRLEDIEGAYDEISSLGLTFINEPLL